MRVTGVRLIQAEQAPLLARRYYARGDPGAIVAALAHVPEVLEVAMPFIATTLGASAIDLRTKELVILRTSALLGCHYCTQTHTVAASDAGVSRAEVAALRGEAPVDGAFGDPRELALLAWTDAVALGPGPVPPAVRATLLPHFEEPEVVELTLLVAATVILNRFCTALELPTSSNTLRRLAEEGWA
jgi:AhpD family alkylhydroperoxidase